MIYTIEPKKTSYKSTVFRSRLEARWAAFFDLVGWKWVYEPLDLKGWSPDFLVEFRCGHSDCPPSHTLLVEIKPYTSLGQFRGHKCLDFSYGKSCGFPADSSAAFGVDPSVTWWEMSHGAGGGVETIENWVFGDIQKLWSQAGNAVQWHP